MVHEKHLGHYVYECFKKRPMEICQVDAATGLSETNGSVLTRSVRLGRSLIKFGLVPEKDIVALSGRGHLDLHIPYYAALFNGLPLLGVNVLYKFDEIKQLLRLTAPKFVFCESESYENYVQASLDLGLDIKIVTFGDGPNSISVFIEQYLSSEPDEDFEPVTVDVDNSYLWLMSTSGSTDTFKVAAFTHRSWIETIFYHIDVIGNLNEDSVITKPALNLSPVYWSTGIRNPVGMPLSKQYSVQTSAPLTPDHVIDIINKYKPTIGTFGVSLLSYIIKQTDKCDFSCFDLIRVIGSKPYPGLISKIRKKLRPGAGCIDVYGQTETLCMVFYPRPDTPMGSVGRPDLKSLRYKLVDPESGKEINEPNVNGELWILGRRFKCYYNDPENTARAFSPDGWYKSGDLFYRDENDNYYFVDRIKRMIIYKNYHVSPGEIENVIHTHPAVLTVAVTSIPHEDDLEHTVACVVRKPGCDVTAQEIKDLVLSKLSVMKQLNGGVIFIDALPMTSNGKLALTRLKETALNLQKE